MALAGPETSHRSPRRAPCAGARLAGLDLGTKTIGIALSDPGLKIASRSQTI